ncbi:MAG: LacI family DNA-binding transcriptional regulator [Fimbriimonadaceae bacterium]
MAKRSTIQDVAAAAGVGKVTVSYILNGRAAEARISVATRDRVLAVARELSYRPNAIARSLVSRRTDVIAVVFQYAHFFNVGSTFINELMRGVCEECVRQNLDVILHTRTFAQPASEAAALMDGRADGVLLLRDSNDPLTASIAAADFPAVAFFTRPADDRIPYVDCDNFAGGQIATRHLIELGHRRIGMMCGPSGSSASNDRHAGYRAALAEHGIDYSRRLVVGATENLNGPAQVVDLMRRYKPTALFCWSDDDAFSCMQILSQAGYRIPDDVSVVGFDGSEACGRCTPPLTSIRQPVAQIATKAVQLLVETIGGRRFDPQAFVFAPTLTPRASVARVAAEPISQFPTRNS